jgi:hypothetical protein
MIRQNSAYVSLFPPSAVDDEDRNGADMSRPSANEVEMT